MDINISIGTAKKLGLKALEAAVGITETSWTARGRESRTVSLPQLKPGQYAKLKALLAGAKRVHGVGVLLADLERWEHAQGSSTGAGGVRPRSVAQFATLLQRYLLDVPGHRVYLHSGDVMLPYYVSSIKYHPEYRDSNGTRPAHADMRLLYEEQGRRYEHGVTWLAEDCHGRTVAGALVAKGFVPETPELRRAYVAERARWLDASPQIGHQYWATGSADDDCDGNPKGRDDSWYWRSAHVLPMEREGVPSRVLIDVFEESPETSRRRRYDEGNLHEWFWPNVYRDLNIPPPAAEEVIFDDEADDDEADEDEDALTRQRRQARREAAASNVIRTEEGAETAIEVPLHPTLVVFDLARHLRLNIHINNLRAYEYNTALADKLVLPQTLKDLVRLLIEHKAMGFQDLVRGKSGGAVVLLAGPPGVGKTLTAEVFAESEQRALYSVQCSQLGTDPEELEDALLKVFTRAARWNAVLLLDEADVYVRQRGADLIQNAIVGVFLRVLEYQSSILFLTTNRPDDVDDAIASRCIARLNYPIPTPDDQRRIWQVLAESTGAVISADTIRQIVGRNPVLSGRDVKNLLKLALLQGGMEVTVEAVEFAKQFKPTTIPKDYVPGPRREE